MNTDERTVCLTAELYETRRIMRDFWSDRYTEKMTEYRRFIVAATARFKCQPIVAPLKIAQDASKDGVQLGEMTLSLLIAAAVEEVEHARPDA